MGKPDLMCLRMWCNVKHTAPPIKYSCQKKLNMNLIKASDLTTHLQEIRATEEQVKWHQEEATSQM